MDNFQLRITKFLGLTYYKKWSSFLSLIGYVSTCLIFFYNVQQIIHTIYN